MERVSSQPEFGREPEESTATAFQYDVPDRAVTVYIDYDLVDRIGFEIMRGFGAVPKRGAEVGGILLGSAEVGDRMSVRVEDFVSVPCEHMRGPSYLLSETDMQAFDQAVDRWSPAPDKRLYVVGYFRSNTRDAFQLSSEDLEILESRFPGPSAICLLVKPYATKPSEARIYLRDNGVFAEESGDESRNPPFPFRRKEMGGGRPSRRPRGDDPAGQEFDTPLVKDSNEPAAPASALAPLEERLPLPDLGEPAEQGRPKAKPAWLWIPLSFIFLLLGIVLGFQIALNYRTQQNAPPVGDPYTLDLTVVQFGDNLHLKWNTEAQAFQNARRGLLHIQDGDNTKEVELRQEDLSRGGVLYRHATGNVRFRLEVFPRDRNSVSESVELRLLDAPK